MRELPAGRATAPGDAPCFLDALLAQHLAALALDAGDLGDAREWLEMHDRWLAWSSSVRGRSEGHALWAEFRVRQGMTSTHGSTQCTRCEMPSSRASRWQRSRPIGYSVNSATAAAHPGEAAEHLDHALHLAESCVVPYEKGLTLIALAALRGATNVGRAEALRLLDEARAICTPLGARQALGSARALHRSALHANGRIHSACARRDFRRVRVEVLGVWMAAGQSDHEIAAALFPQRAHSPRRACPSISSSKTDTENRAAAATTFTIHNGLGLTIPPRFPYGRIGPFCSLLQVSGLPPKSDRRIRAFRCDGSR